MILQRPGQKAGAAGPRMRPKFAPGQTLKGSGFDACPLSSHIPRSRAVSLKVYLTLPASVPCHPRAEETSSGDQMASTNAGPCRQRPELAVTKSPDPDRRDGSNG